MATNKRKIIDLETKVKIINEIQNGMKQSEACVKFNLTKSTVATIWAKREEINKAYIYIYTLDKFLC